MRASRVSGVVLGMFLLTAIPAAAQTVPAASQPQTPSMGAVKNTTLPAIGVTVSVLGGISAVQNVGAMAGAQIGYRVNDNVQIEAEGVWMKDVVTRARLTTATTFATYLATANSKSSTGTVEAPANYFGGSVRYVIPMASKTVHPYISVGGGVARIAYKPTFTLGGADITTSLATYGVTLGSDMTGEVTKPAFGGGVGLTIDRGHLAIDAGVRLLSIQTEGQKTNVIRALIGIGYKF